MYIQLAIGTLMIVATIVIHVFFTSTAMLGLRKYETWLLQPSFLLHTISALVSVTLWLVLGITIIIWCWAVLFIQLSLFETLEAAVYFSIVTFTTLGYGDVTADSDWRILASFAAIDGLVIFGLSTAFLVEFITQLRSTQEQSRSSIEAENSVASK